ncbi:MAG: GNAT family N-acetyltransferase [Bacteroidales bacterium]
MKLIRYDIVLERLKEKDLELVRQHRNSETIRQTMEYREYISPEMQREWFQKINNIHNFYLLIHYQGEKIGLINAKNINWEKQELESGIFLWETRYYETFVPAVVSIMVTDMCFELFNWDALFAHILRTNQRAIAYNTALGYERLPDQDNIENQLYRLTPEAFQKKTSRIRQLIEKVFPGDKTARLIIEPEDFENGIWDQIAPLLELARQKKPLIYSHKEPDGSLILSFL